MPRKASMVALVAAVFVLGSPVAGREKAADIDKNARAALESLYAKVDGAKALGTKAQAILVFPKITKAGFVVGGQSGDGALIKGGKSVAYYNTSGGSFGLQAGAQQFGADGWEVGVGPSIVVMDEGKAKAMTTTTMKDDVYAFIFGQKGLMAGLGLQGNKITKIKPD